MAKLGKMALDVAPLVLLAGAAVLEQRHADDERAKAEAAAEANWPQVLKRTAGAFNRDQITMVAAGITFYTLLALFPAIAAFVSLYGLISDVRDVPEHIRAVAVVLPAGALHFIGDEMQRLATAHKGGLSLAFALALATSIWSANGAAKALMSGLNAAYEEQECRGFFTQTAISLAFTLGIIAFGVAASSVMGAGPLVAARWGAGAAQAFDGMSYPALVLALVVALALLYRYGPSRRFCKIRWFSWGAVAATGLWLAVSALFSLYVGNFAHYDRVYGSFGAVVGFIMWLYLSNMIVMLGAELNHALEKRPAS